MENNNQKIIIFKGEKDPNDIIMEILSNNGLKETLNDFFDKIDKKQEPWLNILYKLSKDFVVEETTDTNFIINIQKQLNISEQVAKNILKEVKEKFLPLVEIISAGETEQETDIETTIQPLEKPIGVAEALSPTKKNIPPSSISSTHKNFRDNKKNIEKLIIKQNTLQQQKKQNDKYKEPIE